MTGCRGEVKTFAGFTFGGGGKTHNCEPATWTITPDGFELKSGVDGGATAIRLVGKGVVKLGEEIPIGEAFVMVPGQDGPATLNSGNIVCQSEEGEIAHGSFDARVKTPDGREFPVVGSFTASKKNRR